MNSWDRDQREAELNKPRRKQRTNAQIAQLHISLRPIRLENWNLGPDATDEAILQAVLENQDRAFNGAQIMFIVDGVSSPGRITLHTLQTLETSDAPELELYTEQEIIEKHEQQRQSVIQEVGQDKSKEVQTNRSISESIPDWRTHCAHGLERGVCAA